MRLEKSNLCTHGPDPVPAGIKLNKSVPSAAAATQGAIPLIQCQGDGISGPRVQVLYVRASNVASRYNADLALFRQMAADADTIYYASAQETGGSRHIRFVQDSNCNATIPEVVLSASGADNFDNTVSELKVKGYNRSDRKYLLFVDASVYCGVASLLIDDQSGPANANNGGPSYARVDAVCWGTNSYTSAHEITHMMGGVQLSAPHSTGAGHCVDAYDVMCYSDAGPNLPPMQYLCPDPAHQFRLDCNHDDYYSTSPPAGSYLAKHWNTANNQFLVNDASSSNLILNSSFESANVVGSPTNWSSDSRAKQSNTIVHSGSYAMRLQATTNASFAVHQKVAQLQPGTNYTVGGWVNIPSTSDSFTFALAVQWWDASNRVIRTDTVKSYSAATSGWDQATATLIAPGGTSYAKVRMVIQSLNAAVYVDDVVFQ